MRQTEPTPCPLQPQHERNYSFLQKGYYSLLVQKPTLVITSLRISCKACTVNVLKKIRLDVFGHFCLNCRVSKNQCRIACSHETYAPINQNKKKSKETVGNVFPCVFFFFACVRQQNSPLDELLRRGRVGCGSSSSSMSPISRHHH
jgi:hypothetical protein